MSVITEINPIIFIYAMFCFIALSSLFIYFIIVKPLKRKLDEQSNLIYILIKKNNLYSDTLFDVVQNEEKTKEDIASLSTSLDLFMEETKERNDMKIYPDPQLVSMITNTIKDQIGIETVLTKNMMIKPKDMLENVVTNTSKTYPMVDKEYITKKSIIMIESLKDNEK